MTEISNLGEHNSPKFFFKV